jgi:DNA-binding winged helix-turn-helix (wHTH) protein
MRIGQVVFDPTTGEVQQPTGQVSRLEPQPAAVLALLAASPGKLVRHEDLRHALWGDTVHVNFQPNLHYAVRQVRRALGDVDRTAPIIESVPRRGYRLLAPVDATMNLDARPQPAFRPRLRRWPLWAAVAAFLAVAIVERRPNDHHRIAVAALQAVHDLVY